MKPNKKIKSHTRRCPSQCLAETSSKMDLPELSWVSEDIGRPEHVSPLSDGRVVVTNAKAGTVHIHSPSGDQVKISPYRTNTGYLEPAGVVSWPDRGVLIARAGSHDLFLADEEGETWDTFPIDPVPGRIPSPYGLALFQQSQQFCLTHCNDLISIHDKYGVLVNKISSQGMNWYIATDEMRKRIPVTDCLNHCVKVFSADGKLLRQIGKFGNAPGRFRSPHGVCTDHQGNIFVSDGQNNRVSMFSPDGRFIKHVLSEEEDITWPKGLMFDSMGRLVVAAGRKLWCWSLNDDLSQTVVDLNDPIHYSNSFTLHSNNVTQF